MAHPPCTAPDIRGASLPPVLVGGWSKGSAKLQAQTWIPTEDLLLHPVAPRRPLVPDVSICHPENLPPPPQTSEQITGEEWVVSMVSMEGPGRGLAEFA